MSLHNDPNWLRAGNWFSTSGTDADIAILGVGASKSAITPNKAYETPAAIRDSLFKYSTYKASIDIELSNLKAIDFGDVSNADDQTIATQEISNHLPKSKVLILLGGDNSITFSGVSALAQDRFGEVGLITLDAHHDERDGISNGSPIRQLVEAGLPGKNIVQIGISDFANSKIYADRVRSFGISVINRRQFDQKSITEIAQEALERLKECKVIYLDIDIDVCDRSVVPAAPAAVPGGLSADQLRELVFELSKSDKLNHFDITEIDSSIDSADQRTARLAALCILEIASAKSL
jgi:formiminoglutamase